MQNKSQSKVENWFLPERGNLVSRRSIFVCLSHNKNCWYRLVSKFRVLQLGQGRTETINAFIERYNLLLFTIRHAVIHALPSLTVSRSRRSALNPDIRPVSYKFYEGKLHFHFESSQEHFFWLISLQIKLDLFLISIFLITLYWVYITWISAGISRYIL